MRLSLIRASAFATVAAIALAACAGHSAIPSAPSAVAPQSRLAPTTFGENGSPLGDDMSPLKLTTCVKSPPQYEWEFKGACVGFTLKPGGASFKLQEYASITVSGSIGKNNVKTSAHIVLVDAVNKNGDILKYKGKTFPPYKANGTTIVYASAINQTSQVIKPISVKGKPVLQYIITDAKGIPGKTCGAAVLAAQRDGQLKWTSIPATGTVKGKSVTISQYEVPSGFELPPKTPLYFAVNCFK
jgi:hypothetical protein